MNYAALLMALLACSVSFSKCNAESRKDSVSEKLSSVISGWDEIARQAEQDRILIDDVIHAYSSHGPASANASVSAINVAIMPVNQRFPGINIKYESASDFCPVLRRLREKRTYVLSRLSDVAGEKAQLYLMLAFYEGVKLKAGIEQFRGDSFTESDVEEIYNQMIPEVLDHDERDPIKSQKAWEESQRYSSDWKDPCE